MRMRALFAALGAVSLLSASQAGSQAWTFAPSPERIRAHLTYLASDELEGRDAGTPGYDMAAAYVAAQFEEMGLKPGGDNGTFLQAVTIVQHRAVGSGEVRVSGGSSGPVELTAGSTPGVDFRVGMTPHGRDVSVSGPVIFAGYGIVAPGIDDYAGIDLRGKVVVVYDGAPASVPAADRQYVASNRAKAQMAGRHGAVGLITMPVPAGEGAQPAGPPPPPIPPAPGRSGPATSAWSWTWERANGDGAYAGVPVLGALTPSGAEKLFAGSRPCTVADIAAGSAGRRPACYDIGRNIDVRIGGELGERRRSANVVAIIEGSDPVLKNQYVVMSGHLDHVGVTPARAGSSDTINNGAMDNAAGMSTLIEAARGFATGPRPRRSVIFLAVTAEEKGLIGADFFANNPTVPKSAIVANVNLDMPVMTYDFIDVAAIGAEHSTIAEAVERAASRMNVELSPDPVPELGIFTRSDHYRFVEHGVPAVFLIGGFKNGGEAKFRDFYNNRYHRPNDDLNQAFDWNAGAKWARLNYEIAWELANQDARPVFHRGDLFGVRFAGEGAIAQ